LSLTVLAAGDVVRAQRSPTEPYGLYSMASQSCKQWTGVRDEMRDKLDRNGLLNLRYETYIRG
jgi:hypothetical protein